MSRYRATDEELDREIAAVEGIVRVRLKRTVAEMRELERDLREMRKERARRRAEAAELVGETASGSGDAETVG